MFQEFFAQPKQEWLQAIRAELKQEADAVWARTGGQPFYTQPEALPAPLPYLNAEQPWQIGLLLPRGFPVPADALERVDFTLENAELSAFQAGLPAAWQLAWALKSGLEARKMQQPIEINLGLGRNLFLEIAKLRAFRQLWHRITDDDPTSTPFRLIAFTGGWTLVASADQHSNLIRTQLQCLMAVLGAADSVVTQPYCPLEPGCDTHAWRLAVNQALLLRHEAGLDEPLDPLAGTWYLEMLTESLVDAALPVYRAYFEPTPLEIIAEQAEVVAEAHRNVEAAARAYRNGQLQFVGLNRYPALQRSVYTPTPRASENQLPHLSWAEDLEAYETV
jgi:hypothetical protein